MCEVSRWPAEWLGFVDRQYGDIYEATGFLHWYLDVIELVNVSGQLPIKALDYDFAKPLTRSAREFLKIAKAAR